MESLKHNFRPIKTGFLNQKWHQEFDLYYQVAGLQGKQFNKFAEYNKTTHKQIQNAVESGVGEELYINEGDLHKYYKNFVIKTLHYNVEFEQNPIDKIRRIYDVSQKILGDFFVGLASVRAFHFLRELINLQAEILIMYGLLFEDVYTVTEKGCHLNTHCANVGLYNMVYGIQKKMEFDEIRDLGFGGMLIEVGMTLVPQKILDKQESLSPEEFKEIRKHPSLGRSILLDAKCCNSRVLRIVGEHHEKFNGEGYPGGFSDKKIFPLAKICSIMDVFDALTSERPYHKPVSPMEAFALMNDEMAGSFDNEILFNFMGLLGALVE